jgi:hypothetical protein
VRACACEIKRGKTILQITIAFVSMVSNTPIHVGAMEMLRDERMD